MKKIENYNLPEHINQLYMKESMSSIGLVREIANKVNELVDSYNELFHADLEWKQTQEGKINKGVLYMKDNLLNSLNELMELFRDSGFIDDRILYHFIYFKSEVEKLSARLDNIIGSTSTDGELIDLRVGADNKNYKSAGDSVRSNLMMILDLLDFTSYIEWSEHPNPKIIITPQYLKFTPLSQVNLLDKNYSYILEGYADDYSHIFTSYTFNKSMLMKDAILSDRVKFIQIKLLRNDSANIFKDESTAISTYMFYPEGAKLDETLSLSNVAPDSKVVGKAIEDEYKNLLKHTVKDAVSWLKILDYRYESNYLLFNLNSKIQQTSTDYKYAIKGYTADLEFIYDSGWITDTELKSVFDYITSERIKYIKILLNTADNSNIDSYSSISLFDIFEPLVLPTIPEESANTFDYLSLNRNIKVINHRGFNFQAPENTLAAFKLSIENGYRYIETDVQFTSDNIPVLIHDETIDRTSNGTGKVNDFTYTELLNYDFGSWFDSKFTGTKIPTLEEFLIFCKYTGVHPYIELKYGGMTNENIISLINMVKKYGMLKHCTFVSSEIEFLQIIKSNCNYARLGLTCEAITDTIITNVSGLKTDENDVFIDANTYQYTEEYVNKCIDADIPLELWVVNGPSAIPLIHPYITGITTDNYAVHQVLYDSVM